MIDFVNYSIEMELEIKNWPHKTDEGMYYDTDMGKVCVAYCFKPEDRNAIQAYLDSIKEQERGNPMVKSKVRMLKLRNMKRFFNVFINCEVQHKYFSNVIRAVV